MLDDHKNSMVFERSYEVEKKRPDVSQAKLFDRIASNRSRDSATTGGLACGWLVASWDDCPIQSVGRQMVTDAHVFTPRCLDLCVSKCVILPNVST